MLEIWFDKLLHMSLTGTYCILIVLAVRLLLMKVKRKYAYYLWMIVFVNLVFPISIKGAFSLIPDRLTYVTGSEENAVVTLPELAENSEIVINVIPEMGIEYENAVQGVQNDTKAPVLSGVKTRTRMTIALLAACIWFQGILVFAAYSIISAVRLNRKIRRSFAVCLDKERMIMELHDITTPFLWGIMYPTIYLPADMDERERTYIIAHEECHRRRGDYLIKIILYAVTVLHWFNPFVWLAYSLCCKDMEISCDETVLERSGKGVRKAYAESLLKYAARQNGYVMTPLTFGEPSVRSRIEHVLRYRKKNVLITGLAIVLTVLVTIGLFIRPQGEESKAPESVEEMTSDHQEDRTEDDTSGIDNNGGEILRIVDQIYYMKGMKLYTDGQYLYISRQDDIGRWWIYRYTTDGSSYERIREGKLLGVCGDSMYIQRDEPDGIYIDRVSSDGTEEQNILGQGIFKEQITSFYATEQYLVFAAGAMEGSMANFVGDFYSYELEKGILTTKHLTDAKDFVAADSHIYYQQYTTTGDGGNELYRADMSLEHEVQIGNGFTILAVDESNGRFLIQKDGRILYTQLDGSAEEVLFDITDIGWERIDGDRIRFSEVNVVGDTVYTKAEQWAYTGEDGWRDSLIKSEHLYIRMDGSDYGAWSPDDILAKQEEAAAYLYNKVPGVPIEDPAANGWKLDAWKDLRKQFSSWSYVPSEDMLELTYLLNNTGHYKLYGSGDYEKMLVEYEGDYAEFSYPYTSNYMIPVDMVEHDYDGDGTPELAIKIQIKHGTGVYIDSFFMADPAEDGLYVYQFLEEDMVSQLKSHMTYERTKRGMQAYVDGKAAGPALEDTPGEKPFRYVSLGNQMQFYLGDERVHISALLEFYPEDMTAPVFDSNAYDVRALVTYEDGGRFILTEFESINTSLDEMVRIYAEEYFTEEIRIIEVRYDVHDTGGRATAVVLPEGGDSYDYLEFEMGGTWNNWTVEKMYLEK